MARKRRKKRVEQGTIQPDGLSPAFPSSPSRPPKYCIYASYPDAPLGQGRRWAWNFSAAYAAQHFINRLIGEDVFKWKRRNIIKTSRGIEIRAAEGDADLEEVMEYEMTTAEREWVMPAHRIQQIEIFRQPLRIGEIAPSPSPRPAILKTPLASRDGLVSVSTICKRLGLDERRARDVLRRARVAKPPCGWAFTGDEVPKIEQLLTKSK